MTRTVRVGEFFDIDWTGAFTDPNTAIVPVSQNTELISVALRAGDVVRCTGIAVGSTTYTVSGVWVVTVTVIAAAATPYGLRLRLGISARMMANTYAEVSSLALSLEENSARANLLAIRLCFW